MKLGRPVKWTETRSENYQSTTHGRDHVQDVELAATRDGKILGLRCTVWAGMGAYLSTAAPGIPTILHGLMLSGPYQVPAVKEDVYGVYTNTTPVEAYRGAGRPEATFMLERMIDRLARRDQDRSRRDPATQSDPAVRERPQRRHRADVRQRQLSRRRSTRRSPTSATTSCARSRPRRASKGRYLGIGVSTLRRDLRARSVAGRWRGRLPGRPVGERDRPLPSERQGQRLHRRLAARSGRGDDVRADRGRRARRRRGRREGRAWRHRQHADGMGHVRQPHDGRRRRGARRRDAEDQGQGQAADRPPARSRRRGHRLRGRQVLRQGLAGQAQDDSGHRADGQRRVEPAAGHGGRPRGLELLRSAELRVSRSARTLRSSKSTRRPGT